MSIIPCNEPCLYQRDGNCELERVGSGGTDEALNDACVHYVGK